MAAATISRVLTGQAAHRRAEPRRAAAPARTRHRIRLLHAGPLQKRRTLHGRPTDRPTPAIADERMSWRAKAWEIAMGQLSMHWVYVPFVAT
jgi:hypothetical protein